jgi:hypothetical protein
MKPEDIKNLLVALESCATSMDRKQVKQLYAILIACGQYPVCPVCNQPITDIKDFTWDHIRPASRGGSDDISNMIPMHATCNVLKGNQYFEELFDIKYEITAEIKLKISEEYVPAKTKKGRKRKKRNIAKFKAWQSNCFCSGKKR